MLNPNIAPLEMLVSCTPIGHAASARIVLEPGDLERLNAGGEVWVTLLGCVVPFDVEVREATP